jgi:TolB-like protein
VQSPGAAVSENANRTNDAAPPVDQPAPWRRIKEHRIAQWTVGYVAVAYGIQHAVTLTSEAYEWPNILARVSMTLLALGLPLAITLAWYHGERTARRVSNGELAVVSVVLLGISFAFYLFVRTPEQIAQPIASTISGPLRATGISVAVLPFVNLSSDKEQEFFSDGMTEEITAALAKIPKLPVVGRTSAFQFKGQNKDLSAIGQALHATYLLEGSVRKAGDRVRITAQLIRAADDFHVWTESYDRELKDVFAVQEDVARTIAASLQVPLGLKQGENLVSNRATDLDSYQQYLRARALYRARQIDEAITVLEQVVLRDPNYAPSWVLLERAYALAPNYDAALRADTTGQARRRIESLHEKAAKAAREAIRLDPKYAGGYAASADVAMIFAHDWATGENLYKQALALDPNDADALHYYSTALVVAGRIKDALRMRDQITILEPFVPVFNQATAIALQVAGDREAAAKVLERLPPDGPVAYFRYAFLAEAYSAEGRYQDAAQTLLATPSQLSVNRQAISDAAKLLRSAPAKTASPNSLPALDAAVSFIYVYVGAPERALEGPERWAELGYFNVASFAAMWDPALAPVRKMERFKALIRKMGLVEYWRTNGWADLCHPTTGEDFECG